MYTKNEEYIPPQKTEDKYAEYVSRCSPAAAAVGKREPYYLTYLRNFSDIKPPKRNNR